MNVPSRGQAPAIETMRIHLRMLIRFALDLTVVEEVDTEIAFDKAPATPQRIDIPLPMEQQTFRSPGAISQMSGTTAISSFSMIEAEFLEPKYMLRHMSKLYESATEFLDHLVPSDGTIQDDLNSIRELLKPDSDFVDDYHDFDENLKVHLKHFKGEESNYINVRAVHRALFGSYNDVGAVQSGINPVLCFANILVLAKQMIVSNRSEKGVLDRLRQLDNFFPVPFVHSLVKQGSTTAVGDSALLGETFSLALELRTQLAVLSLEQSSSDADFEPQEALDAIFLNSEVSNDGDLLRGWNIAALSSENNGLPQDLKEKIVDRYNLLKEFLFTDSQNGDLVDLEGLSSQFPWEATVLELLTWVRQRRNELSASIDTVGGPAVILANIKQARAAPQPAPEEARPAPRDSPRKKRLSFGRQRRRSSRKFDPNAPIDPRTISALKAKERDSGVFVNPQDAPSQDVFVQVAEEEEDLAQQAVVEQPEAEDDDQQAGVEQPKAEEETVDPQPERSLDEQTERIANENWEATSEEEEQPQGDATLVAGEDDFADIDTIAPSGPPKSTQQTLAALKSVQPAGKENRKGARFVDRQPNAVRVEFGDGWNSSQPTPGPSTRVLDKGKQRADPPPSVSRKRAREEPNEDKDVDDDEDEEAFNIPQDRSAKAQERRQKAPVSKKRRVEPPSSAPPSHQPVSATQTRAPAEKEQLRLPPSRQRAPALSAAAPPAATSSRAAAQDDTPPPASDQAREAPPRSQFQAQSQLARENGASAIRSIHATTIAARGRQAARQPRRTWDADQEEAFIEYMRVCNGSYSWIKKYDQGEEGYDKLGDFSQVNLKDKARSMAVIMIK